MSAGKVGGAATLVAAITLGLALAYGPNTPASASATTGGASNPDTSAATTAALAVLPVRVEDTGAHYDRDLWGDWTTGRDGCTTRESVLRRDGRDVATAAPAGSLPGHRWRVDQPLRRGGHDRARPGCRSITGCRSRKPCAPVPAGGARRSGRRSTTTPPTWSRSPPASNTSKGDRDPGRWRPPARGSWCDYATAYVATKRTYRLAVDPAERDALAAMLRTCPGGAS